MHTILINSEKCAIIRYIYKELQDGSVAISFKKQ